jgi:2-oxoglutarate ferredoxin oxidoreductase subunit delta
MAKVKGYITIDIERCKGCELCISECPQCSLRLSSQINQSGYQFAVLVEDSCTGCINCALVCPEAIITVYRENKKLAFNRTPSLKEPEKIVRDPIS